MHRTMSRNLLLLLLLILCSEQINGQIQEEEMNAEATLLNLSARGLKTTVDVSQFANLKKVDLSYNELISVNPDHFNAPNLKEIDLSHNQALSLPDYGVFIISPARILNMSYCNVHQISNSKVFQSLNNLEVLDLRGNPIEFGDKVQVFNPPPKLVIVSEINDDQLKRICSNVDMEVAIIDIDRKVECKDVRRNNEENVPPMGQKREKMSAANKAEFEIVEEGLMIGDTHMELDMINDMMSDDPNNFEGSGSDDVPAIVSSEKKTDIPKGEIEANQVPELLEREPKVESPIEPLPEVIPPIAVPEVSDLERRESAPILKENLQRSFPTHKVGVNEIFDDQQGHTAEEDPLNLGEKKQVDSDDDHESKSRNVIIGLIIAALIMGGVFIGIKVYKDRKSSSLYQVVQPNEISNGSQNDGCELQPMPRSESKPLMTEGPVDEHGLPLEDPDLNCVIATTTMEIMTDPTRSDLPDIDDPNRLSTIVVSNTNLNKE